MNESQNKFKEGRPEKKAFCSCTKCFFFIFIIIVSGTVTLYYLSTHHLHEDTPHTLAQIFENQYHLKFIKQLKETKNNKILIKANKMSGVVFFMNHYADLRVRLGKRVIKKIIDNDIYNSVLISFREHKKIIDSFLNNENSTSQNTEWIFIIYDEITSIVNQVEGILQDHPNDKIIIYSTDEELSLEDFTELKYSGVNLRELIKVANSSSLNIPHKYKNTILEYFGNSQEILSKFNSKFVDTKTFLGEHYREFNHLTPEHVNHLQNLCKQGSIDKKLEQKYPELEEVGVFFYRKKGYWLNKQKLLNYQIQKQTKCKKQIAPQEFVKMMTDHEYANKKRDELIAKTQKNIQENTKKQEL